MSEQRKTIIEQIKDLSRNRKSVSVDGVSSDGISFSTEQQAPAPLADAVISWDVVSFYRELDVQPTLGMFVSIDALSNMAVAHTTISCLSGLLDPGVDYLKNIKYTVSIVPKTTSSCVLSIKGQCQATLYINGSPIVYHNGTSTSLETVSSFAYPFTREKTYDIVLLVYGNAEGSSSTVSLVGDIFKNVESFSLPNVDAPISLHASNNVSTGIRVSWEQRNTVQLQGGGVEIYAKLPSATTYSLLDRVAYPTNFYLHASTIDKSIIPNSMFKDILLLPDNGTEIPNSSLTDSSGIYRWATATVGNAKAYVGSDSFFGDTTQHVVLRLENKKSFGLSRVLDYTINGNGTQKNINIPGSSDVVMSYAVPHVYRIAPTASPTVAPSSAVLTALWPNSMGSAAKVGISIFHGSTQDSSRNVLISDGRFDYTLNGTELAGWASDSTYLNVRFQTGSTLLFGDTTTSAVFSLDTCYIARATDPSALNCATLTSEKVPYDVNSLYSFDIVTQPEYDGEFRVIATFFADLTSGPLANQTITDLHNRASVKTDTWNRCVFDVECPETSSVPKYVQLTVFYMIVDVYDRDVSLKLQQATITKKTGKIIPAGMSYDYKIRNYTNNMRLSDFVGPVTGTAAPEVYYLSMTTDSDYVSSFRENTIVAKATTPLSQISIDLSDEEESNSVPMELVSTSVNMADYTYVYRPLLNKCILYDTFDTDFTMNPNPYLFGHKTISTGLSSAENSYFRKPATWSVTSGSLVLAYPGTAVASPIAPAYPQEYRHYITVFGARPNTRKSYPVTSPNDAFPSGYLDKRISVGMFIKAPTSEDWGPDLTNNMVFFRKASTFSLKMRGETGVLSFSVKGNAYTGGDTGGTITLFNEFNPPAGSTDWYYVHFSVDFGRLADSNYTYSTVYNITQGVAVTSSIANQQTEALSTTINWAETLDNIELGPQESVDAWQMSFAHVYVTADVIKKSVLINNVIPSIEGKSPYFSTFGFVSGKALTLYALGTTSSGADNEAYSGEIPTDVNSLVATKSLTSDWAEPDGSCVILREAFTLNQQDLNSTYATQPAYTYVKSVKLFVDFTTTGSPIEYVRFSNDKATWGPWVAYNRMYLYPWTLIEAGQVVGDTTAGGMRYVYVQAKSESGITSNYWLCAKHSDSIVYNPIGSIGAIESYNYIPNEAGWSIGLDGDVEFCDGLFRGNTTIHGRNITTEMMAQGWVSGQLGFVGKSEKEITSRTLNTASNITAQIIRENRADGSFAMIDYVSDIAVDLYNDRYVYIPCYSSAPPYARRVVRLDMSTGVENILSLTSGSLPYFSKIGAHVVLDETCAYIADNTVVYKYTKDLQTRLGYITTGIVYDSTSTCEIGGAISALKGTRTRNGSFVLYCAHGANAFIGYGAPSISATAIDTTTMSKISQVYLSSCPYTMNDIAPTEPLDTTYCGDILDVNPSMLVCIDSNGRVIYRSLGDNGSIPVEVNYIHSVSNICGYNGGGRIDWHAGMTNVKYPSGISLFGKNRVIVYSRAANNNRLSSTANVDVFIGCIDIADPAIGASYSSTKYSSGLVLPGHSDWTVETGVSLMTCMRIGAYDTYINGSQYAQDKFFFADDTSGRGKELKRGLPHTRFYYNTISGKYVKYTVDCIGFGTPTMVRGKLLIPYTNSNIGIAGTGDGRINGTNGGNCVLVFEATGTGLAYIGKCIEKHNQRAITLKYDGKYLWVLSYMTDSILGTEECGYALRIDKYLV